MKTIETVYGERVPESELLHIDAPLRVLAVRVDSLTRDPKNARKHGDSDLPTTANSIRKFRQKKPIVVDVKDRVIVAGNGTHEAAQTILKWKWIAANLCEMTPAERLGYALADNRTAEKSVWDLDVLAESLSELQQLAGDEGDEAYDPELIGFGEADMKDLWADAEDDEADAEKEQKETSANTVFTVTIKCRGEKHQVEILAAIDSGNPKKLQKAFAGVDVKDLKAQSV